MIPGLCPGCPLLHVPLFVDEKTPSATIAALSISGFGISPFPKSFRSWLSPGASGRIRTNRCAAGITGSLSLKTDSGALVARHVARQVRWILTVEGKPAYQLSLRDFHDLDDLINCLGRPAAQNHLCHDDLDLVVETSSLAPVDTVPGLALPVLAVDQLATFDKDQIIQWCARLSETRTSRRRTTGQTETGSVPGRWDGAPKPKVRVLRRAD
jgi:hypothetical protein